MAGECEPNKNLKLLWFVGSPNLKLISSRVIHLNNFLKA